MGFEAENLLKKYFCACRRTKRTLFAYTELPASTTDTLYVMLIIYLFTSFSMQHCHLYRTQVCEAIGKCNAHSEATESDMILAIYIFEISTMTRLGMNANVSTKCMLNHVCFSILKVVKI